MRLNAPWLGCVLLAALVGCQRQEAPPAAPAVAASQAPVAHPAKPAAPVPLATLHAEGAALRDRHAGVYTGRIENQPAVLWITTGTTYRRGDEVVTMARLVLYRESQAGHPDVVVKLKPENDRRFDVFRACPLSSWDEHELVDPPCEAAGSVGWTQGPPSQWTEGRPLEMRIGDAVGNTLVQWVREVDVPSAGGEKPREDQDWFDALVTRSAVPVGAPQRHGDNAWQPMRHAASGVEWDRPVSLAQPAMLDMIQREVDRRAAVYVAQALEAATRNQTAQTLLRVRYASARWLAMEESESAVGTDRRRARSRNPVWDLRSGKLVRFGDGFRYATLKRLDGSIALDLASEPAPGAEADRGLLGAALRAMGPRRASRCMQRWLDAHACGSVAQCAWQYQLPADLVALPTEEGLSLQFDHAALEQVAKQNGRAVPDALLGPAWADCVQDHVLLPWNVAMQARRNDSQIELP